MSVSFSDCFSDLLCSENSSEVLSGESPDSSSDLESSNCTEESIARFIEDERNFVPGFDYLSRFQSRSLDASAREESVAWILKVNETEAFSRITIMPLDRFLSSLQIRDLGHSSDQISAVGSFDGGSPGFLFHVTFSFIDYRCRVLQVQAYYRFQPLTAYLSVNYFDRFLYSRRLPLENGWPLQLLSVACLSLAAKMEEPLVPSLLDFQVEGAKFIFEPRTILRMELLVLSVLDWRLRSVTPFSFIDFFACKLDPTGTYIGFLLPRAAEIILSNIQEASFLEHWPSSIAAAAILCAANEIPNLSLVNPEHVESWCEGLSKHKIISCYRLMQDLVLDNNRRKPPKVFPQLWVTVRAGMRSGDSSSSSSSSSFKRKKLNSCLWVDDDKIKEL
uniref:B-like cyclin n=1 Tax=Rhizophora mucronata TaxID=61149 RepID=A0A2P2JLW9_RHIMU